MWRSTGAVRTDVRQSSEKIKDSFLDELGAVARDIERLQERLGLPGKAILETGSDGKQVYILQMNLIGRIPGTLCWSSQTELRRQKHSSC